jgi:hypothetical protein
LLCRQTLLLQCTIGPLILGMPFLFAIWPRVLFQPAAFFGTLILGTALMSLASWFAHRKIVSGLSRLDRRLSLRKYYQSMADRHSTEGLAMGFVISLLFVLRSSSMVSESVPLGFDTAPVIGWFCMIFFAVCALAWGYALVLKLRAR